MQWRKAKASSVGFGWEMRRLDARGCKKRGVVQDFAAGPDPSAHVELAGLCANGVTAGRKGAWELRKKSPRKYKKHSMAPMAAHVQGDVDLARSLGRWTYDFELWKYIRTGFAFQGQGREETTYDFPGFVTADNPTAGFARAKGPLRWAAFRGRLSGLYLRGRIKLGGWKCFAGRAL